MEPTAKRSVRFSSINNQNLNLTESIKPRESRKDSLADTIQKRKSSVSEIVAQKPIDIFNDPLYNKNGTRNINIPFDLYLIRKKQEERQQNKKQVNISAITKNDKIVFEDAIKKLKKERARSNSRYTKYLKNLAKSRIAYNKIKKADFKKMYTEKYSCPLKCGLNNKNNKNKQKRSKSRSRSGSHSNSKAQKVSIQKILRPVIKLPPLKTKPWISPLERGKVEQKSTIKLSRYPVIIIPPFKTRKWKPSSHIKPRPKVVIEYPPLKLRKRPWKPVEKKMKKKPVFRLDKLFYPTPTSTLGKTWHSFKFITPRQQILTGRLSEYSKKFGFISNGKQSSFISIVALCTADQYSMKLWKSSDLDEIVSYGDINFRRQLNSLKHKNIIKPSDVYHKIYLRHAKFLVEIGESVSKGIYDAANFSDIKSHIASMLDKFFGLIVLYNGHSCAIWKEENAIYIFNSQDTDEKGKLVEKTRGGSCIIRSTNLAIIIEYLTGTFRVMKHLYEIFSFRVNQRIIIQDLEMRQKEQINYDKEEVNEVSEPSTEPIQDNKKETLPKTGLEAVLFRHQTEPTFGDNFRSSLIPNHHFMICVDYLSREFKNRATYITSTAIVMLQICKSSMWMSVTLEKIFRIGHEVYLENVEKILLKREKDEIERLKAMEPDIVEEPIVVERNSEDDDYDSDEDDEEKPLTKEQIREMRRERLKKPPKDFKIRADIPITEINPIIVIGKMKFEISVEILNIGKVLAKNSQELSLEAGIRSLFKHYDCGLIIVPDVVAIWRENSRYFMFDPNQCKIYSRWREEDVDPFNSCLHCFQNLTDLVQFYIENLPKSQRYGTYKICKIESREYSEKSSDWQNFKGIGRKKWILRGTISESSEEFKEENRNHQSTCMAITALAKTREIGIFSWTSEIIDEIVRIGDEFYSSNVHNLKESEKFENPNLTLSEIGNELKLEKIIVDLFYEESVIYGKIHENSNEYKSLAEGLEIFFKNDDMGIITSCNISVAVLKFSDGFFIFDSHSLDECGRNFNTIDPINSCALKGTACILRFTTIYDLTNHLILNLECNNLSLYNISKVEVTVRSSESPCLYSYRAFGSDQYSAILKAFNDYHEDIKQYACSRAEKTLCNLLSCFCYSSIFNPRFWAKNDINEILKIGWKILCKFSQRNIQKFWDDEVKVEVCSTKFTLEINEEFNGIYTVKKRLLSVISKESEILQEKIRISEIPLEEEVTDKPKVSFAQQSSTLLNTSSDENLKTFLNVLTSIDKNHKFYAILDSSVFTIGIFKLDKFYYVFDPKASMNGMLIKKRLEDFMTNHLMKNHDAVLVNLKDNDAMRRMSMEEKMEDFIFGRRVVFGAPTVKPSMFDIAFTTSYDGIDPEGVISISEKGSAYAAWFTTIELLYQHVLNKIPPKFINESFTLKIINIIKESIEHTDSEKWNNFELIDDSHWIIRGTYSQSDPQFPVFHRNNQDVANCLLALVFKNLCNDQEWNSTVLDVVLKFGDRLFRKSLARKLNYSNVQVEGLKLKFCEMEVPIFIRPYVIKCTEELVCKDSIIKSNDSVPLEHFKETVKNFIDGEDGTGFLVSKNYYVAIWKANDGAFLMFDSHDIGPDGLRKSTGLSSLQRFLNHSSLVEVFWNNIKDIEGFNEYQLIRIKLEITHYKDGEDDVFENMDCDTPSTQIKIIHGTSVKASTEKTEMTICFAVAAHCLCQALEAEFYTCDMLDRIMMFGNELVCECCTNDEVCFKDFNLNKHTSCPDEINWNFQLNNTFTTIQMDIFRRGVIRKEPCPLPNLIFVLEEFFDFYCSGLLITEEFIIALWRDNNDYFVFYSYPIDSNGLRRRDNCGNVGLCIFKSVHEMYTNILRNIRQQSLQFELRCCNIKMTDEVGGSQRKCISSKIKKKPTKIAKKKEIVMPAVSFREFEEKQTPKSNVKSSDEDLSLIVNSVKARHGSGKGFIKYSRGSLMCGKLSKESKTLNDISRKFHSPAIVLYSAAMHAVNNMNCWDSDVIDCVILSGNCLYVDSSIVCGTSEFDITSVVTPMFIGNHEIDVKAESCINIRIDENFTIEQLKPIICELLTCYNACYVKRLWNCWTVVKTDSFYFLFDPRGIKVAGKKISQYHATLYRFESMNNLLEQLVDCVNSAGEDSSDQCETGGIKINVVNVTNEKQQLKSNKRHMKAPKCPVFEKEKQVINIDLEKLSKSNLCKDEKPNC